METILLILLAPKIIQWACEGWMDVLTVLGALWTRIDSKR